MNKKKLIALQAVVMTAVAISAEASETRWHMGIDVGVSQYKQERKQRNPLTYKEVQELLDKEAASLQKGRDFANDVDTMVRAYHNAKIQEKVDDTIDKINAVNNPNGINKIKTLVKKVLRDASVNAPDQVIADNMPGIAANNLAGAKQQAKDYFDSDEFKNECAWGESADYRYRNMENRINHFNVAMNDIKTVTDSVTNYMNTKHHKVDDLVDEELRKTYNLHSMYGIKAVIAHHTSGLLSMNQLNWALTDATLQTWAGANWYGVRANPTEQQLLNALDELKKAPEAYGELLDEVKAKHCEKTSSPRITSPAVEANFGVTRQFGKGVFGAEVLVGVNCKEFGKKKKTDIYKQKKTPVYGAGIVRAGLMLGDRAEVYALGGVRFNGLSPIVGGGARFYSSTKSYFFKAEFQKTLGEKYPKGHTIKLGMGWTI